MRTRIACVIALAALIGACGRSELELASSTVATIAEGGASNPTIALASGGDATYVAWVGTSGAESNVFLARAENDGDFSAPVRVNDIAGDAAPHAQAPAQVAVGPGSEVYVVWQNNTHVEGRRFPASDLRFARSTDGGRTFEPAIHVNDDAGGPPASHTFHDIDVTDEGTIYVTWIDGRAQIGVEVHGMHHAAPHDGGSAASPQIRVARSTDGGRSFEASRVIDDEACPCCRTALAFGRDGEVYVGWRKVYEGNMRDVVIARSVDGGQSFGEPVRVHNDGWVIDACPHAGPALAVDRAGRLHVAWFTGAEDRTGAYYATSENGGQSFADPVRLTPAGAIPTTQVRVAADEQGAVWVAWENPEGSAPTLLVARLNGRGAPRSVDAGAPAGKLPAVSARGDRLAVAWLDGGAVRVLRGIDPLH
jgi:hypothetical protein